MTQSTRTNTGQVAVTPLNKVHLSDVKGGAKKFDEWLKKNTNNYVTLDRLKMVASAVPIIGNVIALIDVVNDVVIIANKSVAKAGFLDWVTLGIDLIGVVPIPPNMAAARTSLRPSLFLVKQAKATKGNLSDTVIVIISDHLNDTLAGSLENFANQAKAKLPSILDNCGKKIQELTFGVDAGLKRIATGKVFTNGQSNLNAAKQQASAAANTSIFRDPRKVISNAVGAASELAKAGVKTATNTYAGAVMSVVPTQPINKLAAIFKAIGTTAPSKIKALNNPATAYSIGWLIDVLINAIKKFKAKRKAAVVKPTQTSKAQNQKPNQGLEKQGSQVPAKSNPDPKKNCPTGTAKSISFALGTEFLTHLDAHLNLPFDFNIKRTYASNLYYLDDGEFGARWITPFSLRIVRKQKEQEYQEELKHDTRAQISITQPLEFIYFDGRPISLQKLSIGEVFYQSIEGFYYSALTEDLIFISFDDGRQLVFERFESIFRLSSMRWENNFTLGLNYNHHIGERQLLSDIVLQHDGEELAHIHTKINNQHKVSELFLLEQEAKVHLLAQYQYNHKGDLISVTNQDAHQYQYQYHQHLLTRYTDFTGRSVYIQWDGEGADARAYHEYMDGDSHVATLQWDDNIRLTYVTNADGDETWYYYDYEGYNYRIVYPDGLEEWFFRDDAQNVVKHVATDGSTTLYDFDEHSNLITLTQADGNEFYYGYNDQNKLTHFRDAEGNIWRREYDENGNITIEIDPLERKTQYQYNTMGLPTSIQDAKGGIKQLSYNKNGQIIQFIDCSGKKTVWNYDARGRLISKINALNEQTQYIYTTLANQNPIYSDLPPNAIGQLEKIIHADGSIEQFIHDAEGRLLVYIDPKAQRTEYMYDQAGRIYKRIDAMGQSLEYQWDKLGRLTKLINENGASYSFHYDVMGRLLREVDFDGKETIYQYSNTTGELERSIELAKATTQPVPMHRIQQFEFDAMGRLVHRVAGFSTDLEQLMLEDQEDTESLNVENAYERLVKPVGEELAYDGNGQLIQAKNTNSRVQFFYNEIGNLSYEHHHDLHTQRTAVWKHLYDELNNRITTHRPDGHKVDWLLYGSGYVYGLSLDGQDTASFKRDDLHREIERHYANGLSQIVAYDELGRLTSQHVQTDHNAGYLPQASQQQNAQQQTQALLKRIYHYDKVGHLTDIHDNRRGHIEYKYDPVGRLLEACSQLGRETFAFDPASNILNPSKGLKTAQDTHYEPIHKQHGYNSLVNNIVQDYYEQKYHYDAYGQLIRLSENGRLQHFEWDALGRLVSSKNDDAETYYRYDALGRRIEKQKKLLRHRGATETTYFGWDGNTLGYETTTQYTKHYVYEKNSFIPLIQATYRKQINQHQTPIWENGYDYEKDPLWHTEQKAEAFDQVWYYHCDHLGTPQEMTDQTGTIVWSANYKAWGECKTKNHTKRDIWDSEIITNNIRFQGQYYDDESGLHYNRYRYYSPYVGRFISKDPIGLLGGHNVYAYVPNPVEWIDPYGLSSNCPLKCPAGTIDPSQVHFMQSSAKNQTGDYTVLGNSDSLKNGELDPEILRAKVWKDSSGKIWTLDHRRLAAFRLAKKCMPISWASSNEVSNQMWKMTTTNGGTSMRLKLGNGQSKEII